jgi:ADP-ribose pyrophosphatase YjhB (NUDIX family)
MEGGKWALVGGFVDRDETIKQAVAREVMEETGYEVGDITLFRIIDTPDRPGEDRRTSCSCTFASRASGRACPIGNRPRFDGSRWRHRPSEREFAFDHYSNIRLYREFLAGGLTLPLLG